MFLNGVIGYQSPNSQGVARASSLSPALNGIGKLEDRGDEVAREP